MQQPSPPSQPRPAGLPSLLEVAASHALCAAAELDGFVDVEAARSWLSKVCGELPTNAEGQVLLLLREAGEVVPGEAIFMCVIALAWSFLNEARGVGAGDGAHAPHRTLHAAQCELSASEVTLALAVRQCAQPAARGSLTLSLCRLSGVIIVRLRSRHLVAEATYRNRRFIVLGEGKKPAQGSLTRRILKHRTSALLLPSSFCPTNVHPGLPQHPSISTSKEEGDDGGYDNRTGEAGSGACGPRGVRGPSKGLLLRDAVASVLARGSRALYGQGWAADDPPGATAAAIRRPQTRAFPRATCPQ